MAQRHAKLLTSYCYADANREVEGVGKIMLKRKARHFFSLVSRHSGGGRIPLLGFDSNRDSWTPL